MYVQAAAKRLNKDDIFNLIQLPETIWKVALYPDLACVVGVKELMDEHNLLLDTKSGTLLGYDTTFKLGDFYVSILVFRHAMFNESCHSSSFSHSRPYVSESA